MTTILTYKVKGTAMEMVKQLKESERDVTMKVDALCDALEPGKRWCDPDFGPTIMDPKGAKSLYRSGRRTRISLPDHNIIKWMRPNYTGHTPATTDVLCEEASLFKGGHCSGDVIQGQLGDCWFISALAMIANEAALLDNVFFCGGKRRKEHPDLMNPKWIEAGIWVCRFVDRESFVYVIIDDSLPTSPKEKEKLVFARCKDITELWVPLCEKAYAKYYGSYDSLTGGFSQIALRDLTGLCPECVEIGDPKQASPFINDKLIDYFKVRFQTGSLVGASCENPAGDGEGKGSQGLVTGHAYSVLALLPVETDEGLVNLVVMRNPWGEGEWTGTWGDKCPKKRRYLDKILEAWNNRPKAQNNSLFSRGRGKNLGEEEDMFGDVNNGVFLMDIKDFQRNFNEVISAIDFPENWRGRRVLGSWVHENSGGNSSLPTWRINPSFKLKIPKDNTRVFITLDQEDKRKKYGIKFPEEMYAIAFRLVPGNFNFGKAGVMPTKLVPNAVGSVTQISFAYSESCCLGLEMNAGEVFIVPSTYQVGELGEFTLSVYCDVQDFELDCSDIIGQEEQFEGFRRHTHGHFGPLVQLNYDPKEYFRARRKIHQLITEGGHDPNELALRYKEIPSDEKADIVSKEELLSILLQYGITPDKISDEMFESIKGVDRELNKSDLYLLFHNERFFRFRRERKRGGEGDQEI